MPKAVFDHALEIGGAQEGAVGIRRGGKPVGRPDAERCQGAPHLAERGVLPTYCRQIGHADLVEPANPVRHPLCLSRHVVRVRAEAR
jgi:hypothetical protein